MKKNCARRRLLVARDEHSENGAANKFASLSGPVGTIPPSGPTGCK